MNSTHISDEEAYFVQGQHEPLISESLFYKVQGILDGNRRGEIKLNTKIISDDNFPLRGFLVCPKCGRNLTGSASKGRSKHYYYYHCIYTCNFRQKADETNVLFERELQKYEFPVKMKGMLKKLLLDNFKRVTGNVKDERQKITCEIDAINSKISKARDMLLMEKIDEDDYRIIKLESKDKIDKLEEELSRHLAESKEVNINECLDKALTAITSISTLYEEGGVETKRYIIGSIYPEKIEFDGTVYRTARRNVIAEHIFKINNKLRRIKTGITKIFFATPV